MNNEKMKQVLDWQWEEGVSMVACTIFHGNLPYQAFLDANPDAKAKKYVDDWLNWQLVKPENKGKIIPGFNDKKYRDPSGQTQTSNGSSPQAVSRRDSKAQRTSSAVISAVKQFKNVFLFFSKLISHRIKK